MRDEKSNWWEWDPTNHKWSFAQTENHLFGIGFPGAKRIGDMDREDLLRVIATGYHDRETLAKALIGVGTEGEIAEAKRHAHLIVGRIPVCQPTIP